MPYFEFTHLCCYKVVFNENPVLVLILPLAIHLPAIQNEGLGKRLAHGYPFMEAEVAYCARNEYCESAVDFIARRSRLAFLDTDAAGRALPRVIEILAAEHKWDKSRKAQELKKAKEFLETFKSSKNAHFHDGKH